MMKRLFLLLCLSSTAFGNDVVTVFGDSIFGYGHLQKHLKRSHGIETETYAVNGAKVRDIVQHYNEYRVENEATTILMDAGGNDVLKNDHCYRFDPLCKDVIMDVVEHVEHLLFLMELDRVERVVFLGYYRLNRWPTEKLNPAIDLGSILLKELCDRNAICEYIDPREAIDAYEGNPIGYDRVHPNRAGYRILAELVSEQLGY